MLGHGLLGAIATGAIFGVMFAAFRWLLTRGGKPTPDGDLLVYHPRPGVRVLGILIFLMGLFIWGFAVYHYPEGGWSDLLWLLAFSLFPIALAAFVLLQRLTVDATGLHYERALLPSRHIPWDTLSHYEVNASAVTSIVLFRPRSGRDTIALSSLAYNVNDLLARVTRRTGIVRQPYGRRSPFARG